MPFSILDVANGIWGDSSRWNRIRTPQEHIWTVAGTGPQIAIRAPDWFFCFIRPFIQMYVKDVPFLKCSSIFVPTRWTSYNLFQEALKTGQMVEKLNRIGLYLSCSDRQITIDDSFGHVRKSLVQFSCSHILGLARIIINIFGDDGEFDKNTSFYEMQPYLPQQVIDSDDVTEYMCYIALYLQLFCNFILSNEQN